MNVVGSVIPKNETKHSTCESDCEIRYSELLTMEYYDLDKDWGVLDSDSSEVIPCHQSVLDVIPLANTDMCDDDLVDKLLLEYQRLSDVQREEMDEEEFRRCVAPFTVAVPSDDIQLVEDDEDAQWHTRDSDFQINENMCCEKSASAARSDSNLSSCGQYPSVPLLCAPTTTPTAPPKPLVIGDNTPGIVGEQHTHSVGSDASGVDVSAACLPTISFLDFRPGDIALFLPMDAAARNVWSAFNSMKQHYYLSEQSMSVFLPQGCNRSQRVFVLGRIVLLDAFVATSAHNPYKLQCGTQFHVCHVEPLTSRRKSPRPQQLPTTPTSTACESPKDLSVLPRISFLRFRGGDLALFLLGNKQRNIWMAFHSNRPYHFLSDDSLSVFMSKREQRVFILGRLVLVNSFVASAAHNPYGLQVGTEFHVCYAEPINSASSACSRAPLTATEHKT